MAPTPILLMQERMERGRQLERASIVWVLIMVQASCLHRQQQALVKPFHPVLPSFVPRIGRMFEPLTPFLEWQTDVRLHRQQPIIREHGLKKG